jgi:hypothetical protein
MKGKQMKLAKREQRVVPGKSDLECLEGVERLPTFMGFLAQIKKI